MQPRNGWLAGTLPFLLRWLIGRGQCAAVLRALCLLGVLLASCQPASTRTTPQAAQPELPTPPFSLPSATASLAPSTPTSSPTFAPTFTALSSPTHTPTSSPSPTPGLPVGALTWEQAREHDGEQATVCGLVVDSLHAAESQGKPTFLNLGLPYPEAGRFTILIWGDRLDHFPGPPEELYFGKVICASGQIELYRGVAEMVVEAPDQIFLP